MWEDDENEPLPTVEVNVFVSTSLSRSAIIDVNDYKEVVNRENNHEGGVDTEVLYDFKDTNLLEFFKKQHLTLEELLKSLRETVDDINANGLTDQNLRILNRLADEGECWSADEEEAVID